MAFECAYPLVLVVGGLCFSIALLVRKRWVRPLTYRSGLATLFVREQGVGSLQRGWQRYLVTILRGGAVVLLVIATARPRTSEERITMSVDGVGILLALDVSNSMSCFDDMRNPVSRFVAAQEEAQKFVMRRPNDLFGLVFFGRIAATRCPLTMDHRLVTTLLRTAKIGALPADGTALAQAIIMGVQRLKNSKAKNNIIVLLTDGEPSADDVSFLADAIACAQKAQVKVYAIGMGSAQGGYAHDPGGRLVRTGSVLNTELLEIIAQKTGGAAFKASNQRELGAIYETIDRLEKTVHEEPVYTNWYEWYWIFAAVALLLLLLECGMAAWYSIL